MMLGSSTFNVEIDKNDDFPKVDDIISKHKANIQRYAQKFNV